jgi:hypothetical protein
MIKTLSKEQAETASFLCKFADFSYCKLEASEQLDPTFAVERGWIVDNVRSIHDPSSGMDFTFFVRVRVDPETDKTILDLAVTFRGAQVTWRPQWLDVVSGLNRGLPQWRKSRDLVLRKLHVPMRRALLSGGKIYITGQSMGHMLVQFAAADIVDDLAHDPTLEKHGNWTVENVSRHVVAYGFGGVGVDNLLTKIALPNGRKLSSDLLRYADVKHFVDDYDPARLLTWVYAGDSSRTWSAPKPYQPFRTAVKKSLIFRLLGIPVPNILLPVSFLWHFFYTAHSVTGYNISVFERSTARVQKSRA